MYVGYHDANNVPNVGGEPVTQLNLKKRRSIAVTPSQFLRRLLRDHEQTAAGWKVIPA